MAGSATVKIIRDTKLEGLSVLAKRVKSGDRSVLVGVPDGKTEPDGTPLATIAAVHEFGSGDGTIPERSFLRGGIHRHLNDLRSFTADGMRRVARGGYTVKNELRKLGAIAAGDIQKYITSEGDFQPNAPSTVERKGSSHPLIDTGQLRQSITWKLEYGGGEST